MFKQFVECKILKDGENEYNLNLDDDLNLFIYDKKYKEKNGENEVDEHQKDTFRWWRACTDA